MKRFQIALTLTATALAALLLAVACEAPPADEAAVEASTNGSAESAAEGGTADEADDHATDSAAAADSRPTSAPASQPADDERAARGYGSTPANIAAGATRHYGADFTIATPPLSLHEAIETCGDNGSTCKLTGTIASSCQTRGCWFVLNAPDVDRVVRIRMQDYGFFVPRNSAGATAIVEGTIEAMTLPIEMARHYAEDAVRDGEEPREVTGPEEAWQITITGALLTMPSDG